MNNGFEYMGKTYVWYKNELYRMPMQVGRNFYGLKKCKPWNDGYIIGSSRKSMGQLIGMTTQIEAVIPVFDWPDCPF